MLMITLLKSSEAGAAIADIVMSHQAVFILLLIIGGLGWLVQWRLNSVFEKYSKEPSPKGMTGAEAAEKMLRDHNIHNVKVTHTGGILTDHYNPSNLTVNLSDAVYSSRSIAAVAVACHECGHAIQHAQGYAFLQLRSQLVPIVNISSRFAQFVIIGGILLMSFSGIEWVCWLGVAMVAMSALFSIITLPVEYNASSRALEWMESTRLVDEYEIKGARTTLRWAARTYLVAAISAIATILYYIVMILARRRK